MKTGYKLTLFLELKYSACWLDSYSGMTWSFVGPAIAVIVLNLIILCKVIAVSLMKTVQRSIQFLKFLLPELNT